jgi:hypothetical protein
MFSGGRDSTLAATRLDNEAKDLVLVTITSTHLMGVEQVHKRLRELSTVLHAGTQWVQVRQPDQLMTDTSFYRRTCLPCHHAYVVVACAMARSTGLKQLALGYAGYQNTWPEQTPYAVDSLTRALERFGIELLLPVYDIASREQAIVELRAKGLAADSLEQKCSRQVLNVALSHETLIRQVALWERAIDESLRALDRIPIEVIATATLREGSLC